MLFPGLVCAEAFGNGDSGCRRSSMGFQRKKSVGKAAGRVVKTHRTVRSASCPLWFLAPTAKPICPFTAPYHLATCKPLFQCLF